MKLPLRFLLLAALLAVCFWVWLVFFPNPKTVIRHRLKALAQIASFPANEGDLARMSNVQKLTGFFTDHLEVRIDAPGLEGHTFESRGELMQAALLARTTVMGLQARFSDPNIEITAGKQEAIVDLALNADVGGEKDSIFQELKFNLKKVDGTWLVTRIETVKSLR